MRKKNKIYTITAVIIGLLIFLNWFGLTSSLEQVGGRIFSPVLGLFQSWSLGLNSVYNKQGNKEDLLSELKKSREELNKLRAENIAFKVIDEENQALRKLLNFTENKEYSYIVSQVISRGDISDVSGRTETIIINRGKKNDVVKGAAIVDSSGVLVGKVTAVKDFSARVDVLNSSRCRLAVSILNSDGTSGIVMGELGLSVVMNTIPQDKTLKIDDTVITSGLEEAIPRGLAIGKIIAISKENNELWQSAQIEPFFKVDDLLIVAVIKQ
ncbi:MAG: rod shape-determining protein MreC [Patescibacteria group bacterium]|nr:rod shape-determining protein MreC [Patescibacteria group bacterium]